MDMEKRLKLLIYLIISLNGSLKFFPFNKYKNFKKTKKYKIGDNMESILNNIGQIQNGKQAKYMNDIKNIGMGILFGQVDA